MKILNIRLINFASIFACRNLKEVYYDFDTDDKTILQIVGPNRSGKTVLIQQLHPFSSINLSGDERSDLQLIIPGETGIKEISYRVDDRIYHITHTYKPTPSGKSHTIISSLICNGEEMNPSGGVNTFNTLIEKLFGLNRYTFQFTINGTQLASLSNMSSTQRKTLLNKALGVDIYDKIHKLATDDHRYANKLITSLNNSKEYILTKYGTYENLQKMLHDKQIEMDSLLKDIDQLQSSADKLHGKISMIQEQHPQEELGRLNRIVDMVKDITNKIGNYDDKTYIRLSDENVSLNNQLGELKSKLYIINKDIDDYAEKKNNIQTTIMKNRRSKMEYDELCKTAEHIENEIKQLKVNPSISGSPDYFRSLINLGQNINSICKDIASSLNENLLKLLTNMIVEGIDVPAFLMKENAVLMDTEKEQKAMARLNSILSTVPGEYPKDCCEDNCIYRNINKRLESYFKSYQTMTGGQFTEIDIENMERCWRNVTSINRLINTSFPDELKSLFSIENIMASICSNEYGVDINIINKLYEDAVNNEHRLKLVTQLENIRSNIKTMESIVVDDDNPDAVINDINNKIDNLNRQRQQIISDMNDIGDRIQTNETNRSMVSQISNINIGSTNQRIRQLETMLTQCNDYQIEYTEKMRMINDRNIRKQSIYSDLHSLETDDMQCKQTMNDLMLQRESDRKYKLISDATSSTKGFPVIMIRNTLDESIKIANHLLDVIYEGTVQLLEPDITETTFDIPFSHDLIQSKDIRYGSQSESTIFALTLSLSLSSQLSNYNIILVDEIDAYLDHEFKDKFILMLDEVTRILNIDQLFIISHNVNTDQFENMINKISLV